MASAVLDASALLAHIRGERGSDTIADLAADALMSTVNLAEVFSRLMEESLTVEQADAIVLRYGIDVVPFDEGLARRAGALRPATKSLGLSLGDRACLALAQRVGLPVLTADRTWAKLAVGVEVKVIR
jgi:PIN domain nuclease of toxin-antitoxin system